MPVWDIKHSPNTITPGEKEQLAKSITNLYVSKGLPAFYVQVHFSEDVPGTAFVGGEQHPNFAAVTIYHVARSFKTDEHKQKFLSGVDEILNPMFAPKGMDWEYFIAEASRDLWKMNGLVPPMPGSEGEKLWAQHNKAIAF
jgi:phenylpyruvate tautomerase PptA (4-oxalocrotonate tautomerase family)